MTTISIKKHSTRLTWVLTSLLLCSCATTMLIASATVLSAFVYDHRDIATMKADLKISHTIENAFEEAPLLQTNTNLHVNVVTRHALLFGQVTDALQKKEALKLARKVPNIKKLYNQIEVGPTLSTLAISHDAWITSKVKARMLAAPKLRSLLISVSTFNQKVFLVGTITKKQAALATKIARKTSGVEKVVRLFVTPR
jgi:osmotically-inducible protein OsmY